LTIGKEQYDHYWSKGWIVVERVYTPEDADRVAALAVEVTDKEYAGLATGYLVDCCEEGKVFPRKIDAVALRGEVFRSFLLGPNLRECIETLLGEKALPLADSIFMKPPHHGSAKPYHQDNFYFQCYPGDQVITAWIALDDVDVTNGCLRYIDGSHRGPILPHHPMPGEEYYNSATPADLIDLSKESLAPVRKGGVVFHHSHTLHTSHRNESNYWRRGYATHWVTANVTCKTDTLEKASFKRTEFQECLT
jgi:phytanoyl-CoA hydroxylase